MQPKYDKEINRILHSEEFYLCNTYQLVPRWYSGQTAIPREVENLLRKHGLYTSQAQTTLRKVLINSNVKAFPSNVLQQLIEIFKLARKLPESEALLEFLSAPLSAS
ncbi:uncharacterized protein LOC143232127 isoform X1 [Tachypleus tridentatus]|uniref:uncharacterized protein LOC143232127 isoform X1 n=1 Tax=Tachypleus tridentatus TaxID=6853 RepID=UPI003FD36F6A